ncbi:fumarylacetoacetate hydrolase family protein [Candidatus Bathyarchaeota archaeon]|nr:fumarylacetoacetate hydrolase family protein [Candidatus Bathyarchaeota archaeon]
MFLVGDLKLARFTYPYSGKESYGVILEAEGGKILDLTKFSALTNINVPSSIRSLISKGLKIEKIFRKLTEKSSGGNIKRAMVDFEHVILKAPIVNPPKIVCLGLNYKDHAEESGSPIPREPIIFMKPRTAIIGPEETIIKPNFVQQLDYEIELAIIIGKKGKNISISEAKKYIFGYTILNDVSARDIQFKDGQWTRGKSFDTFAPIGPYITTIEQINDPNNLRMITKVNGEIRQNSLTKLMIFNVYEIVHHISRVMTLEPCDIIATGTPSGVAAFMKPEPKFLKNGDVIEMEIENIGILRNIVVER